MGTNALLNIKNLSGGGPEWIVLRLFLAHPASHRDGKSPAASASVP